MTVVAWLLDSDPAIRWQAMRDLTDESADVVAAERARVASEGWGARLLERQAPEEWAGGHREVGGVVCDHDIIDNLSGWQEERVEPDFSACARVVDRCPATRAASDEQKVGTRVDFHADCHSSARRNEFRQGAGPQIADEDLA